MKLRHIILTALSCIVLVGAEGSGQSDSTDTTGMGGGSDGGMQGQMNDSMMIAGTIESVDTVDSMIVVRSETATDTVYYNSDTNMKNMKNKLTPGEKVVIKYKMIDDKKVATHLIAGMKRGMTKDTSTTPGTDTTNKPY